MDAVKKKERRNKSRRQRKLNKTVGFQSTDDLMSSQQFFRALLITFNTVCDTKCCTITQNKDVGKNIVGLVWISRL